MTDDKKQPEDKVPGSDVGKEDKKSKWSTGAKVGAAVGSAAVAAALIYAGRHKMRKMDELKSAKLKSGQRYENEPDDDEPEDDELENGEDAGE